jgi:hypothetical protein
MDFELIYLFITNFIKSNIRLCVIIKLLDKLIN